MISVKQIAFLLGTSALLAAALPTPDSAGQPPLPGPGLSYGGIPYGSVSGNVGEYFRRQAPSSLQRKNYVMSSHDSNNIEPNFAPIEQWL